MDRDEALRRYNAACHAMQSGVAACMEWDEEAAPKHLRVGINSAMVEHSALAKLLVTKGIISDEEYLEALAVGMEEERDRYQNRLREHYGHDGIKLA